MTGRRNGDHVERWRLTREKILMAFGISLISFEAVITAFGAPFRFEFLLAGLACMGISIAQWGDKREAAGPPPPSEPDAQEESFEDKWSHLP